MFKVLDKKGVSVNLKDEVTFTLIQTGMFNDGEEKEVAGIVVALLNEEEVQVQPEEGPAVTVIATHLVVTNSLINQVEALCDADSMRKLILDAERRYASEAEKAKPAKKSRARVKGESRAVTKVAKASGVMKL